MTCPLKPRPCMVDTDRPYSRFNASTCNKGNHAMSRSGAVTFKGKPMTLAGNAVTVGQKAPEFKLHTYGKEGLTAVTPADLKGKATFISVVPSLDTPVCQLQTKK